MTDLTENSPAVRLYAAMLEIAVDKVIRTVGRDPVEFRNSVVWIKRLAAEHERLIAERTAELEARAKVLESEVKSARLAALREAQTIITTSERYGEAWRRVTALIAQEEAK